MSDSAGDTLSIDTPSSFQELVEWPPSAMLIGQVARVEPDGWGYMRVYKGDELLRYPNGEPVEDVRFPNQELQLKKFEWAVFHAKAASKQRRRQQRNEHLIEARGGFILRATEQTGAVESGEDLLRLATVSTTGGPLSLVATGHRLFLIEGYDDSLEDRLRLRHDAQARELDERSEELDRRNQLLDTEQRRVTATIAVFVQREAVLQQQSTELNENRAHLDAHRAAVELQERRAAELLAVAEHVATERGQLLAQARATVERLEQAGKDLTRRERELEEKQILARQIIEEKERELERRMERWGLRELSAEQQLPVDPLRFDDEAALLDHVQGYLSGRGFSYSRELLANFYTCLKGGVRTPVVLSGLSGAGKSSLVRSFAEAIGGLYRHVAVRANWTDDADLRGFFHPERRVYHATPFMHALNEAREHADRLVLICLDEMNLSRVEYYLAELLSTLELDNPTLDLYSTHEYRRAAQERDRLAQVRHDGRATALELERLAELEDSIDLYPARFSIPSNVRFCGTVNIDETTQPFSDKVLDRVQIIQLEQVEFGAAPGEPTALPAAYLSPAQLDAFRDRRANESISLEWFSELNKHLELGGFHFGHRVRRQIDEYCRMADISGLFGEGGENIARDLQLVQKILPKLRGLRSQIPDRMFDGLMGFCVEQYPRAYRRIKRLRSMDALNYWELFRHVGD